MMNSLLVGVNGSQARIKNFPKKCLWSFQVVGDDLSGGDDDDNYIVKYISFESLFFFITTQLMGNAYIYVLLIVCRPITVTF